jgi:hypothetical protein
MSKYSNGRMVFRSHGRYAKAPSLQAMGFDVNTVDRKCDGCGHVWFPILISGECPQCGNNQSTPVCTCTPVTFPDGLHHHVDCSGRKP